MSKATEQLMAMLHGLTAQEFIDQIKNGEPVYEQGVEVGRKPVSAAVLNAARAFLKDNHIEVDPGHAGGAVDDLKDTLKGLKDLPFSADDGSDPRH